MKLWSNRLAYFFAGLALLFVVFILVEHFRGEWALNAHLKTLTSKGEKLSVAALKPKRVAPDQNVFAELLTLTNQLKVSYTNLDFAPPPLRLTPAGRAVVVTKLNEWSSDEKTTNDWQKFGSAMEKERGTLIAIEAATQKPAYDSGIDYEKGFVDFQLLPLVHAKQSCQLLGWSVLYALRQGNLESAHKDLQALVTLTTQQTPEPLIICQLVRRACSAIAFNATWQALQSEGWSDAQLTSLQDAWKSCDFVKDMAFSFEMERAMTLDFFSQIRESQKKLDFVFQQRLRREDGYIGAYGVPPALGIILSRIHLFIWRAAWAAQDELAGLELNQCMVEGVRLAHARGWVALAGAKDDINTHWWRLLAYGEYPGGYDGFRFLFAIDGGNIMYETMIRRTLEAQTQQQMVLTALGIERYRLRNGGLPSELSALVPVYLATMPHDFMDGKDLKYKRSADGKEFVLYSAGEDGRDDGGDATLLKEKEGKSYRSFWDGRDAVWPSAATAEEAKLAMQPKKPN